jgi:hypothetical protein
MSLDGDIKRLLKHQTHSKASIHRATRQESKMEKIQILLRTKINQIMTSFFPKQKILKEVKKINKNITIDIISLF